MNQINTIPKIYIFQVKIKLNYKFDSYDFEKKK